MVAAVRQQKQEEWGFHSVQREDTKFAMSLYNGEVTGKLQVGSSLLTLCAISADKLIESSS